MRSHSFERIRTFIAILFILQLHSASGYSSPVTQSFSSIQSPLFFKTLQEDHLSLGLGGSYFSTTQNYSESKKIRTLPYDGSFSLTKGTIGLGYGVSKKITAFADVEIVQSSVANSFVTTGQLTHGDADLGFRYTLAESLTFEAGVLIPTYKRESTTQWSVFNKQSPAPVGNGLIETWAGVTGLLDLDSGFELEPAIAYQMRTQGFSNNLLAAAHLRYTAFKGLFFKLGASSQIPIQEDSLTGKTAPPERSPALTAQSLAFNSMNPFFVKGDVSIGYSFSQKFYGCLVYQKEIIAKNTSDSNYFALNLAFTFGKTEEGSRVAAPRSREFRQYTTKASITKINSKNGQFLIDKGRNDGISNGQNFDVFPSSANGEEISEVIGQAVVIEAGPTRSKLQIREVYNYDGVKEGYVVRKPVD